MGVKNNLYSTTAITPPQICRDPITAAIAGAVGAASGTLAYSLISIGVSLAVSAVTSWALAALAPEPEIAERGLLTNLREAAAAREYVYGEVRKGGVITYMESTGGETNAVLHQIITVAGHEVESLGDVYINDEVVTLSDEAFTLSVNGSDYNGGGWVTSEAWMKPGDTNEPRIRVLKHLGNQTTSSSAFANESGLNLGNTIINESATLNSNFVGRGCAYLYIRMDYDPDVFASGIPLFTVKVKGRKVYDPVTATTAYSANFANCVRDYIVSDIGLDEPTSAVDDTAFSSARNVSNEAVSLDGGGTENRYELNGVFSADQTPANILQDMMTAGAATLFWGQGLWQLRPGYYSNSVMTLTEDDLRSAISLDTRIPRRDNFNSVAGTFIDKEQDWVAADYPAITSSAFLSEDNNIESQLDLALPFTTSASMAQRLAKLTLFRGREQQTFQADFGTKAFGLEPGDTVALTFSRYGWSQKEFEVVGWNFGRNQEAGDLRVTLNLRETSSAAFDWNAEENDIIRNNTNLPDPLANLIVANVQVTSFSRVSEDGTTDVLANVTWDSSNNAFITGYEVQWRETDSGNYNTLTTSETSAELTGLTSGEGYTVRVRSVSSDGRVGQWAQTTFTAGGDTTTPNAPTATTALGGFQSITVGWADVTTNTDSSPFNDFLRYNVYRSSDSDVGNAAYVGSAVGRFFTDTGLADNTLYYYWVTAVDNSGNESAFSTSTNATTNFISAAQMVADIRDEIGAARIDVVSSLPSEPFDYAVNDYVFLTTDDKLYRLVSTGPANWEPTVGEVPNGTITGVKIGSNAVTAGKIAANSVYTNAIQAGAVEANELASNSVIAGKIAAGAVSADKIAVTDLAAISANLGSLTAGSINTVTSGTGIQVNISGKPNAFYSYQDSALVYAAYFENVHVPSGSTAEGGAVKIRSNSGYGFEVDQYGDYSGEQAAAFLQNSQDIGAGPRGGAIYLGRGFTEGNYGAEVLRGGYYDSSGDGYSPFTGAHEGIILKTAEPEPGDILCDVRAVITGISDSLTEVAVSSKPKQGTAVGVFTGYKESWHSVAAFMDREATSKSLAPGKFTKSGKISKKKRERKFAINPDRYSKKHNLLKMNSLGEGGVNVCGENGNIKAGDLICTSSIPGKGMRQDDDIIHSYSFAKAREDVKFSHPSEVKLIACIYLGG